MKNEYEVRGEVTAIFLKRKDGTFLETLVDTKDLDKLKKFNGRWYATLTTDKRGYYAKSNSQVSKGKWKSTTLHRWLMGATEFNVDHKNHNTLDNRSSVNLRIVTQQQNCENQLGARVTSKSNIRGVCWHAISKKWVVQVTVKGKRVYYGYFDDIVLAEKMAIEKRSEHMNFSVEQVAN